MSEESAGSGDRIAAAARAVGDRLERIPEIAIVLGSGMGLLAERLSQPRRIPYAEIPHFPRTTVVGHQGELVAGSLGGAPVLLQSGRFHLYEGHPPETVTLPVRVFAELGV